MSGRQQLQQAQGAGVGQWRQAQFRARQQAGPARRVPPARRPINAPQNDRNNFIISCQSECLPSPFPSRNCIATETAGPSLDSRLLARRLGAFVAGTRGPAAPGLLMPHACASGCAAGAYCARGPSRGIRGRRVALDPASSAQFRACSSLSRQMPLQLDGHASAAKLLHGSLCRSD